MPRRDEDNTRVARKWLGNSADTVLVEDIADLIATTRRADRARVRRIVRRELADAREWQNEGAIQFGTRILAALREGKGTR